MQQPTTTLASTTTQAHQSHEDTTNNLNVDVEKTVGTVLAGTDSEPPFSVFTLTEKKLIVLTISFIGLVSPLSASIYFPAINTLAKDLHVSTSDINLTVTTYLVSRSFFSTENSPSPCLKHVRGCSCKNAPCCSET